MLKMCTLFCLVQIINVHMLTSCVFSFMLVESFIQIESSWGEGEVGGVLSMTSHV